MNPRKPLIAGNWKMYKNGSEAVDTAKTLLKNTQGVKDRDVMIAPPFTSLALVSEVIKNTHIGLGAQNIYFEKEGAFTGEISPGMVSAAGCDYVIIGHSERRQYFGETDEQVNKKIKAALAHHLIPVFCIGETEQERESNATFSVLDKQVKKGLEGLFSDKLKTLIIAYEPVWAIGTGKTATNEQAQEIHAYIRGEIEKAHGAELSNSLRILYGGSVKPGNIAGLMAMDDIDGALVGGASLDADIFSQIVLYK
jgi:triosephosphate isomerase